MVPRRCVGERGDVLVYKRPEPQPEVAGELPHLLSELGAQVPDVVQVVLHGQGEVHQVVQVHRIILHLSNLQLESCLVTCANREAMLIRGQPTCWGLKGWILLLKPVPLTFLLRLHASQKKYCSWKWSYGAEGEVLGSRLSFQILGSGFFFF